MYYLAIVEDYKIVSFWSFDILGEAENKYEEIKNIKKSESLYVYNEDDLTTSKSTFSSFHVYAWDWMGLGGQFFICDSKEELDELLSYGFRMAKIFKAKDAIRN